MSRAEALIVASYLRAALVDPIVAARAELLTAGAFVIGWLLITVGIVRLTSPTAWFFSLGLLLISLGGWKVLRALATDGLYALTRDEDAPRG